MTILLSVLAFVFGWMWNTYVMAVALDGSNPPGEEQTIATAQGRPFNSLFWLLFFSLVSGLITYGWQRGWRNLFGDLAVLPRRFGLAMSQNAGGALAMLLWGVSVSLIISTVISSAVSLALGLVLLTLAATPLGTVINFAVIRLWRALTGIVAPSGGMGAVLVAGPFLVMLGEAAGLLLDWLFASWLLGLILGLVAAVASVLLARGASPSPGTAASVLIGLFLAASALWSGRAWGDDGGWQECQTASGEPCSEMGLGGIFAWFGSEGANVVIANGAVGGLFAGIGTAIGVGVGSVAASLAVAGASAAAGLGQQPGGKATGQASVPQQGGPAEGVAQHGVGQAGQQVPQQGGLAEGVPQQQGGPQQGAPQQGAPGQAGPQVPQQAGPAEGGPQQGVGQEWGAQETGGQETQPSRGSAWQTAGFNEPTIPQQPTMPVDDVMPEPPDRKRDEEDGKDPQA